MTTNPADHIDGILTQWHAERPELDVRAIGTFGRLFRSAHLADVALAEGIAPFGLQPGWFDLLAALRRSGTPYELNPTNLMQATLLTSGGVTKRLDRLDAAGLVERRPDPGDRRGTLVRLTRKGKVTIDRAVRAHARNEDELLRTLTAADRRALDGLLRKLLAGLEQPAPGSDRRHGIRSPKRSGEAMRWTRRLATREPSPNTTAPTPAPRA